MSKTINWKFPFIKGNEGIPEGNKTTVNATREDLKVLLMTRKGERLLFPTIGTNITTIGGELFNNINRDEMLLKMRNEITSAVTNFLPNITLNDIQLLTKSELDYLDDTSIMIKITYSLKNAPNFSETVALTI